MSGFEHGESRILLGIGPSTGFIADVCTVDESLSFPSDEDACLTGVHGDGSVPSENERCGILPPPNVVVDFADRSSAASLMLIPGFRFKSDLFKNK